MIAKENVLVLSAGRRVELVQAFQNAGQRLQINSKVFATDMNPRLSAACHLADGSFKVSRVTAGDYIEELLRLCTENDVGLVVPTIDTELHLLAKKIDEFSKIGVNLIISSADLIEICRDKRESNKVFGELGIDCPKIYDLKNIVFPCFCKPYDGSCSIGAQVLHSSAMLTDELVHDEKNMFMELVDKSYCEYTIDAYYDASSKLVCIVPRERIEVRGGEVSKGATRKNFVYEKMLPALSNLRGARGCVTVQVFANPETEEIKGLEINPRFGGGYPLADAAGAHYAEFLLREYFMGEKISFFEDWEDNLLMLRYDAKVVVNENSTL